MRRVLSLFIVPLSLLGLIGCADDGPDIDVESSTPVRVEAVSRKPIREYAFTTGTVLAVQDATLRASQEGYYRVRTNPRTGRPFAMGDEVKKGETIIRLENPEYENQVSIDSKRLNFEISQREFDKQKGLYEKGGITLRELTDAERTFIDARYSFENAQLQLAKLNITPLFDGVIIDLPFHSPGELIETGATMAQITDYSELYAEVSLPGKEISRLKRGQEVLVTNYASDEDTLIGVVNQVSPALDPDSRMFKLTLRIPNDSLTLRPGMFVKTDIVVDQRDSSIVISKDVIIERRGNRTVYVVDKGIARERRIEIGLSNRTEVEVLSGLTEDDRLVVEGFETLRNRAKVKILK